VKNHAERYRRFLVAVAAALGVAAGTLFFLPTPAQALSSHAFSSSFGSAGSGAGELSLVAPEPGRQEAPGSGVAVNDTTHDVYVADTGNHRIDEFESNGMFIRAWGWGVQDGLPKFEECTTLSTCQAGISGAAPGQFEQPTFVAVDNSGGESEGDVYVGDPGDDLVSKFSAVGALIESWGVKGQLNGSTTTAGSFGEVGGIAVDSGGTLMVINKAVFPLDGNSRLFKFAQDGSFSDEFQVRPFSQDGLAVDSEGNFFKINGGGASNVEEFTGSGSDLGQVTEGLYAGDTGIAVDPADGDLYVDKGGEVEHYAFTGRGIVSEAGAPACGIGGGCQATDTFGSGHLSGGAGVGVDPVSGSVYVAATSADQIDVFNPIIVPDTVTEAPSAVSETAATLHGTVDPDGIEVTSCQLEYGTEPGVYTDSVACSPAPGEVNTPVPFSAVLSGLRTRATYYYRISATNASGTNHGRQESFTLPGHPRIDGNVSAEVDQTTKAGQTTATLRATIDPEGRETTYHFEYGETESYGTSAPIPAGALGSGEQPIPVTVDLTALKIGTTYHYRVVASNEYGSTESAEDQTFTTLPAALVEASVSEVASTSATLNGTVNPLGTSATCQFQYVPAAGFQTTGYSAAVSIPCFPAALGSGESDVEVSPQHITGLEPGTVYHYRLLTTNTLGTVSNPEQTFTTQTAYTSVLPDGRQWEMVSPPNKNGALIEPIMQEGVIQAAAAGDAMTYHANAPTEPGAAGYSSQVQVLSTRGVGGWSTKDIALPHPGETDQPEGQGEDYRFFSEDLSLAVVQPFGAFTPASSPQALAPGEASEQTAFLRTDYENGNVNERCTQSCYRPLVTGAPGFANVPPGTKFGEEGKCPDPQGTCGPQAVGMSPDGKHVVLNLGGALYEWSAGKLAPVSVPPGGEALVQGGLAGSNAISANGSRVVWTEGREDYFIRDLARGETLELGTLELGSGAKFEFLNAEGSRVFLGNGTSGSKVCEVKLNSTTNKLECVTTSLDGDGEVIGISRDGSYVYYVAREVQTTTENSEHAKAELGAPNLYMRHYGGEPGSGGWETPRFIATLTGNDGPDVGGYSSKWGRGDIFSQTSRVSPNGQWLSFMSNNDLTDYDDHDAVSGKPDEEVYLYGAAANRLVCASCNPSGARPVGASVEKPRLTTPLVNAGSTAYWDSTWLAANIPAWTKYAISSASHQSRYLSDSGRLFFNSHDALVPQDVNGNWDVYEYEPPEVGDCSTASATFSARSDGCVGLISSGESDEESAFLDASETGGDVFFLTTSKLAPQDYDKAFDVYDAHECTGASPCAPPSRVAPPECTTADACRAAPSPQPPIYGAPASQTFAGVGNLAPAPMPAVTPKKTTKRVECKKSFVKKKTKCISKPKKKSKAKKSAIGRK